MRVGYRGQGQPECYVKRLKASLWFHDENCGFTGIPTNANSGDMYACEEDCDKQDSCVGFTTQKIFGAWKCELFGHASTPRQLQPYGAGHYGQRQRECYVKRKGAVPPAWMKAYTSFSRDQTQSLMQISRYEVLTDDDNEKANTPKTPPTIGLEFLAWGVAHRTTPTTSTETFSLLLMICAVGGCTWFCVMRSKKTRKALHEDDAGNEMSVFPAAAAETLAPTATPLAV